MLLTLLLYGLVALLVWCLWQNTYWWRQGVISCSYPSTWPLLGNIKDFIMGQKHFGQVYEEIYNSHPQLAYVGMYRLFGQPAVLVRSQEVLKDVLIRNFQHFQDNSLGVSKLRDPIIYCNPFVAKGEQWRQMRSEIVPIFTPNKVKLSFPHVKSVCDKLTKYVADNLDSNCFEAKNLFTKYTLDVTASSAFGLDAQAFENSQSEFTTLVNDMFLPNPWSLLHTVALLFSPTISNLIGYHYVSPTVQQWLQQIIGKLLKSRAESTQKAAGSDFLQWLCEAKEKLGEKPNNSILLGHAGTLLFEGFETSSSLMAFAMFEFAKNSELQQKVIQDIDEALKRHNGELCYEAVQEMSYLDAALYETLRLYPGMQALLKQCTQAFQMSPQTAGGKPIVIEKDTVFVLPVKAIHRDPAIFEYPSQFMPERFLDQQFRQGMGCKFLGFGEGPRMCPGMRFGLVQSKAGIAALLSKYTVQLSSKETIVKLSNTTFLTAAENGIAIRFNKR